MPKITPFVAVGLIFAAGGALARSDSFAQNLEDTAASTAPPLTICLASAPNGLDPARGLSGTASDLFARAVFDTLVTLGEDGVTLVPRLALWWEMSPDRLTYTFRLRADVAFHQTPVFKPSRAFSADDVVFSFQRQLDPAHPLAPAGGGNPTANIASVEKIGDDEVRFTLKAPNSGFLLKLARDFTAIQSAEYGAAVLAAGQPWMLDTNPIGTGPFSVQTIGNRTNAVATRGPQRKPRFEVINTSAGPVIRTIESIPAMSEAISRKLLKSIKLTANSSYWGGAPSSENLVVDAEPDTAERYGRLVRADCQVMPGPAAADISALAANRDINLVEAASTDTITLAFNTQKTPLDDQWVRLALSEAIDIDALGRLGGVNGSPAGTLVQGANDLFPVERRIFSPDFARSHLAGAGIKTFDLRLLVPVTRPGVSTPVADQLARAWRELGLTVKIEKTPWADMMPALSNGDYDIALVAWRADGPDLAQNYRMVLSCDTIGTTNASRWCDKGFMADLEAIDSAASPADRMAATTKAVQKVATDLPILPLLYLRQRWAIRSGIGGLDGKAIAAADLTRAMYKSAQPMTDANREPDIDPESGENVAEGGG